MRLRSSLQGKPGQDNQQQNNNNKKNHTFTDTSQNTKSNFKIEPYEWSQYFNLAN